jgi:prophage regulatory protein
MADQPTNQYRLIKLPEVERITGKGRTSIYSDPSFPRPLKIGPRASAWVAREVLAWIQERIEERDVAQETGHDSDPRV